MRKFKCNYLPKVENDLKWPALAEQQLRAKS